MRGGNQEKVARSEAEHEGQGVTRCRQALSDDQLCHTHTFATPRFTDEESRLGEVTRPETESPRAAKLGEPTGRPHVYVM